MRNGSGAVIAVAVLGAALAACKKRSPPVVDVAPASTGPSAGELEARKLLGDAKERMLKLEKLAAKARNEPAVKKDRPHADKVSGDGLLVIGEKWFSEPRADVSASEVDLKHTVYGLCASMVYTGIAKEDDAKYLRECLGFQWVAVVRARKTTLPKVDMATSKFKPGFVEGDVLLFEVSTGEVRGRYRLAATNGDTLSNRDDTKEGEWDRQLLRDLRENVLAVVTERLNQERKSMYE